MSNYQLITFDMDGTLLDDGKNILPGSVQAIELAAAQGKTVCISSGRCLPEIQWLIDAVPSIHYVTGANGAFIYDAWEKQFIHRHQIDTEKLVTIMHVLEHEPVMPVFMADQAFCQEDQIPLMPSLGVPQYQKLYQDTFTHVDNIYEFYFRAPFPAFKMNIYSPSTEYCTRFREAFSGLELETVINEQTYLELTAKGVSKGAASGILCRHLGISPEATIAVGDENNDIGMLKAAGFAVAMGNANSTVKQLADAIVADNNSGGCAEAIMKYLL